VAFADGSVHSIQADLFAKKLESLLTVDGGETVQMDELLEMRLNWTRIVVLVTLVASVILLLVRPQRKKREN